MLLGLDLGSSSVKAALLDPVTGRAVASAASPDRELPIDAPQPGWAEQDPALWWTHVVRAVRRAGEQAPGALAQVQAIGVAYQMHGLVLIDEAHEVLRPSIIWCDGRAAEIGARAFETLGPEACLSTCGNSPGNFTASKLRWVQMHEPDVYARAHRAMLPGDYVAMRLTGRVATTASGLSEGIFWHLAEDRLAHELLDHYDLDPALLPERVPTFGEQGRVTAEAAEALGVPAGTPVTYRAGDQPNNALALGVMEPGQLAATAGTSGVVYGVADRMAYDPASRVNTFLHVSHRPEQPRFGVLLCLNGVGSLYRWLRDQLSAGRAEPLPYDALNALGRDVPVGAEGLSILPFGNGPERILENRPLGASLHGIDLNRHGPGHLVRAAQEGIAFAFRYGTEIMRSMGLSVERVRVGTANLFQSEAFATAFATAVGASVDLVETDGALGAARGAGLGAGCYAEPDDAFRTLTVTRTVAPDEAQADAYEAAYARWHDVLTHQLDAAAS